MRVQITVYHTGEHKREATSLAIAAIAKEYGEAESISSRDSGVALESTVIFPDPPPTVAEPGPAPTDNVSLSDDGKSAE